MMRECPLYAILSDFSPYDTPGIGTFYDFFDRLRQSYSHDTATFTRSKCICKCREKGIFDCNGKRYLSQPDTNAGWYLSRECYFNGYHLFMFVASDSFNDLPVFPILECASRHDILSFLHSFFSMKSYLPEFKIEKLLLDSAMDAIPVYDYCKRVGITPFIDLKKTNNVNYKYKDTFTIDPDGVQRCSLGLRMKHDGIEYKKNRYKFRYAKADSKQWKKEYDRRTSVESSNKREKQDYKLEGGKHRSSKMWSCRLYGIMML